MKRIEWIEFRLENWARWVTSRGAGVLGYASVNLAGPNSGRDGYIEAAIPTNEVEASDTDAAVARLPGELKATVIEVYAGPGGLADHLRRLCCSKATMHARVGKAHHMLAEHFNARDDRRREERQRLEALGAARGIGAARGKAGSSTP